MRMAKQELHLEVLLGKRVFASNGRAIGRIEEVRAELRKGVCYVDEFLVGTYAIFERLSAWSIGRGVLSLSGSLTKSGYKIPWDKIDFTDPEKPKITCTVEELPKFEGS
jgi:sporulation protein YlmC with PRC-barrel domain